MPLDKNSISKAVHAALEAGKGKRKFVQSVDVAINFKDVDFNKPENRLNIDVVLPFPPKESKVAVFADGQAATEAKAVADLVITSGELNAYATDKEKQALLVQHSILATTALIAQVGKSLGQALSKKGKLPKPIMPNANLKELVERTRKTINVRTKGKYLPCVHCIVGREDMSDDEISENVLAVLENVFKKISEPQITSVYVKTTMGPAVKV